MRAKRDSRIPFSSSSSSFSSSCALSSASLQVVLVRRLDVLFHLLVDGRLQQLRLVLVQLVLVLVLGARQHLLVLLHLGRHALPQPLRLRLHRRRLHLGRAEQPLDQPLLPRDLEPLLAQVVSRRVLALLGVAVHLEPVLFHQPRALLDSCLLALPLPPPLPSWLNSANSVFSSLSTRPEMHHPRHVVLAAQPRSRAW